MSAYEPELGQALFGQPHQEFDVPEMLTAALDYLGNEIVCVVCNRTQNRFDNPRHNSGTAFRCAAFGMWAYQWGFDDDEDRAQPCNFHHPKSGLKVSWYKYGGRGESANMVATPALISDMLVDCLSAVRAFDVDDDDEGSADFAAGYLGDVPYFDAAQSPVTSPVTSD